MTNLANAIIQSSVSHDPRLVASSFALELKFDRSGKPNGVRPSATREPITMYMISRQRKFEHISSAGLVQVESVLGGKTKSAAKVQERCTPSLLRRRVVAQ